MRAELRIQSMKINVRSVESLRYGQLSTLASDIARRNIGYTMQQINGDHYRL